MFSNLTIFVYKHSHPKARLLYFLSNRLPNSPTMAAFPRECCKSAETLLNLPRSLFCNCNSMHSMGINLRVGRCTVPSVLGTFHEAPLTSLSDSPFISPITTFSWSSSYFTVWFTFNQSYYELFMKLLSLHCLIYLSSVLLRTFLEASHFTVWFTFHQPYYELFMKLLLLHCCDLPFINPITNFSWSSSYFTVWFTFR